MNLSQNDKFVLCDLYLYLLEYLAKIKNNVSRLNLYIYVLQRVWILKVAHMLWYVFSGIISATNGRIFNPWGWTIYMEKAVSSISDLQKEDESFPSVDRKTRAQWLSVPVSVLTCNLHYTGRVVNLS